MILVSVVCRPAGHKNTSRLLVKMRIGKCLGHTGVKHLKGPVKFKDNFFKSNIARPN